MHKNTIWIHCSATRPEWMEDADGEAKVAEITRWHTDKGWNGCGYARIIDRDGRVYNGRDLDNDGDVYEETGAHVKGYNKEGIGICLIGGFGSNENDNFLDNYTPAQEEALRREIERIQNWALSKGFDLNVRGHNEVAAKACPGFNVKRFLGKSAVTDDKPNAGDQVATAVQTIVAVGSSGAFAFLSDLSTPAQVIAVVGVLALIGVGVWKYLRDTKQVKRRT